MGKTARSGGRSTIGLEASSEVLFDDVNLKILLQRGEGDCCLLAFTGVGHALGGVDVQKGEFTKFTNWQGNRLYLIDKQRSWGNNLDFSEIKKIIEPHIEGKKLFTIGNSMGGFLAILFTRFFNVSSCVAFSAQFSVHESVVPDERRWRKYIRRIQDFRFKSLDSSFREDCAYYLFFGDDPGERMHSRLFPGGENIHSYEFAGVKHNVAAALKDEALLYDLIDACFGRQKVDILLASLVLNTRKINAVN